MGASLAGTIRLKTEPIVPERLDRSSNIAGYADNLSSMHRGGSQTQRIGIDSTGILDIGETEQLSIADRALMRKYKSLETVRENLQQAGIYKQEITSNVSRVDGHPLKPSLSLYDRALLRKYPDANSLSSSFSGKQPLPSSASISVSSPPVVYPIESARFFLERGIPRKQMLERTHEATTIGIRDFSPRLQSLLFLLLASLLPQL